MLKYLYIGLGGAAGAIARFLAGGLIQGWTGSGFPWGTLAVNLTGCLVIGAGWEAAERLAAPAGLRVLFFVGFLGAYTTFSTYGLETIGLFNDGRWKTAAIYILASNLLGLACVWFGFAATRRIIA